MRSLDTGDAVALQRRNDLDIAVGAAADRDYALMCHSQRVRLSSDLTWGPDDPATRRSR